VTGRHAVGRPAWRPRHHANAVAAGIVAVVFAVTAAVAVLTSTPGPDPPAARPSPEIGIVVPALQHQRVVPVTVNVWAGERLAVFPATPTPP
jgi:hypothetical protein